MFRCSIIQKSVVAKIISTMSNRKAASVNWNAEVKTTILPKVGNTLIRITDIKLLYFKFE